MIRDRTKAIKYLERATQLRAIADGIKDPENRRRLIDVAESYEPMAAYYAEPPGGW